MAAKGRHFEILKKRISFLFFKGRPIQKISRKSGLSSFLFTSSLRLASTTNWEDWVELGHAFSWETLDSIIFVCVYEGGGRGAVHQHILYVPCRV